MADINPDSAEENDDRSYPVTIEWLVEKGWDRGIHWPNIFTDAGQLLEWRGAGCWIGETPIALAVSRGRLRRVADVLGCAMKL